jgi:hypothetical protein
MHVSVWVYVEREGEIYRVIVVEVVVECYYECLTRGSPLVG